MNKIIEGCCPPRQIWAAVLIGLMLIAPAYAQKQPSKGKGEVAPPRMLPPKIGPEEVDQLRREIRETPTDAENLQERLESLNAWSVYVGERARPGMMKRYLDPMRRKGVIGSMQAGKSEEAARKLDEIFADLDEVTDELPRDLPEIGEEEIRITNPTSGVELWVKIARPADASSSNPYPAAVYVPGGLGFGSMGITWAERYAREGFVAVVFDPDGRGLSDGEEDYNGPVQQDGLHAILKCVASRPDVKKDNIGLLSGSYGVALAAGVLGRYPDDPPVKYYVDCEGPTDRFFITLNGSEERLRFFGHSPDEADWWRPREAVHWAPKWKCRYVRVQASTDHAQGPVTQHAIDVIRVATDKEHGGEGQCPWTRINREEDNPPNRVFTAEEPPNWLGPGLDTHAVQLEIAKEMAARP